MNTFSPLKVNVSHLLSLVARFWNVEHNVRKIGGNKQIIDWESNNKETLSPEAIILVTHVCYCHD